LGLAKELTIRRQIDLLRDPADLKLEYYENEMLALVCETWERIG
jgi:hypothetical protein